MTKNPRVIIVDPDPDRRGKLQQTLALSRLAVLGEAGYGVEAVSLAQETKPDVIVMALAGQVNRALKTLSTLVDTFPQVPIIVYSPISDSAFIRQAMVAGAKDFLTWPIQPDELRNSIFGVLEQEGRRRQRLAGEVVEPVTYGTIITVFGAKGGIGKTTIATNLAVALAQKLQQSVCLVDLDTRFGDVALMLDIQPERTIADLFHDHPLEELNKDVVREYLVQHPTGVMVLPAPIRPTAWRQIDVEYIERTIHILAQIYDYVILDTPGTFNDVVGKALEMATIVLMVTSMDMASVKDTLLALDMLDGWSFPKDRVKITINQINNANSISVSDIQRVLEREIYWHIPYDQHVANAAQLGTPVLVARPSSKVAESLVELAYAISGAGRPRRAKGLLRLVPWLAKGER